MDLPTADALLRTGSVIPVTRALSLPSGARALPRALASGSAFLLESTLPGVDGWEPSGVALLGFRPRGVWRAWGHRVEVTEGGVTERREEERPLESLAKRVGKRAPIPGLPRFSGGLVGYLGWGAARWFEPRVPARLGADPRFPDAELLLVDDLAAVDWEKGSALLIANVEPSRFADTKSALRDAEERLDRLAAAFDERASEGEGLVGVGEEADTWTAAGFEAAVESVLRHVRAGDCMQTVLSRRITVPFTGDPLDLYEQMRGASRVPYHFLVRVEDESTPRRAVLGASPELLLRVADGRVTVKPIAGTRPRGETPEQDAAREAELRADPKERAEHVMLVDLGRNDVGRVAAPGSVSVDEREVIYRFSHVMHMVSAVSGALRDGLTSLDALAAAFPAGTVSGAPKVRAMQIIDAEEPVPRGPYGGAVGTVCYDGNLVMAIHLRSVALAGQELRLQAGAGIVSDSIPAQELAETEAKLASVRAALRWRRW
jgi:anthranilate synthase component 1